MANITLLKSPARASVEKRIIRLLTENPLYWHKEDRCNYFILSNQLYGYNNIKLPLVSSQVNIFWKDFSEFEIIDDVLKKDPTYDFKIIETFREKVELYDLIRIGKP